MEKKVFESAISAYTTKIVEHDSKLVKYVMSKSIPTEVINRTGEVIAGFKEKPPRKTPMRSGRPLKKVCTPIGWFSNINDAAEAYNISVQAMRGRLRYARLCGTKDYYVED